MWRLAPRQLSEDKHSIDRQIRRIDRGGTDASISFAMVAAAINRWLSGNSEKTNLQGRVQWHTVSSVTCHVTWRVMEMQRVIVFSKRNKQFVLIASRNLR